MVEETRIVQLPIVKLYADGGLVGKNPSSIGGVWAWCAVNSADVRVRMESGFVPPPKGGVITNNHTEQVALILALEAMPEGWSGQVCSDSKIALGRLFWGYKQRNVPLNVMRRGAAAVKRLGQIEAILLQGHPTEKDLAVGIGSKRGLPVSEHNVWCDKACTKQAKAHKTKMSAEELQTLCKSKTKVQ
jgi:ribonuclease HI